MWPSPKKTANLVTFTEEILKEKLFCAVTYTKFSGHTPLVILTIIILITMQSNNTN